MSNTLYLFIVRVVGYTMTRQIQILAPDQKDAEEQARRQVRGGLAYIAQQAQ